MQNYNFKGIPTSLFLNGPKLGIVTDPQNQTNVVSIATFTGIATASFPNPSDGVNDGTIEFKWYFDGEQILDSSVDEDSFAEIIGFSSATGTGSTITLGLSDDDDDNGKEVYFTADYVPSAYSQPTGSAVTAGTARSTGNAFNEPLKSGTATITTQPIIEITSQPEDQIVGRTFEAKYSIAAKTTPGDGPVEYQWQLDGNDLSDGTTTTTISDSTTGQIRVTNDANSDVETIDFSELSSYNSFETGRTYTLTSNADIITKLTALGAGGGFGQKNRKGKRFVSGTVGGIAEGLFTFVKDQEYKIRVGSAGGESTGGELTGLFIDEITFENSILIGGGGGGSSGRPGKGGAGGGLSGGDGSSSRAASNAASGGTQTAGGIGGSRDSGKAAGSDGSQLQGGSGGASGGDGYYGGGGGSLRGSKKAGPGGGGSGYFHPTLITEGVFDQGTEEQVDGEFRIQFTSGIAFPEGDKICVKTSNDSTGNEGNINAITDSTIPGSNPGSTGSVIYRVYTGTQEFIIVNFETVQTGVTEIKINGGAFTHNALYNFYINNELVFSDRATVLLWSDDTLSLPKSYDISSIKIEGADGYALGNLRFNDTTVIGEIGRCVLVGDKQVTTTISGSQTDNLSITSDAEGAGAIRCKVSASNVQKSPVFSKSASYYVVAIRNVVKIEQYNYTDGTAILSENNLSNGGLSLSYDSHPGNAICLYAAEQDINVEVDMYGGKGSDNGSNSGGEGGYSKIRFTMKKDQEYILTGLFPAVNAPFLYRKASVIAIVGGGGMAGVNGNGGLGGGIGVSGSDGKGRGGGHAPTAIGPGEGGQRARFGSKFDGDALTGGLVGDDHQATDVEGGDSAPCPRGIYWRNQGKSPCEDLGTIKFRTPNGTEISNTAEIDRGYKSGYNAIQTAGAGETAQSGDGGNGYSGGWGGRDGGGGGGAYGYTDGSVTVVSTTQGGSTGPARINIKLSAGDFFIDNEGRILIFSTKDNRDPRTLTKTTGVVNYGDNACIDDARWQRFLDLARDGTQDYRLAVTTNNSTTKITGATEKNIYKMMNGNALTLRTSLTGWVDSNYAYTLLALAWDETSNDGMSGYGGDYSILSWSPTASYGYGFYGASSVPFFNPTVWGYKGGVDFWILPPGVPDF